MFLYCFSLYSDLANILFLLTEQSSYFGTSLIDFASAVSFQDHHQACTQDFSVSLHFNSQEMMQTNKLKEVDNTFFWYNSASIIRCMNEPLTTYNNIKNHSLNAVQPVCSLTFIAIYLAYLDR